MKAVSSRSWQSLLRSNDAAKLWHSLNHLVSIHPLVRSARRNPTKSVLATCSLPDITQDLYLQLLQKARFEHYLTRDMTDIEIEREIYQVELTNLLIGRLRQRHPESYRLARRIATVLENNPVFRVYSSGSARYNYASGIVYGLTSWADSPPASPDGNLERLIADVPVRVRDLRKAGCTGESQVIITNPELTELLVEILQAINSPLSLKTLRSLALSRLPVYDFAVSSIDQLSEYDDGPQERDWMLATSDGCPERVQIEQEDRAFAAVSTRELFCRIERISRSRAGRAEKLWRILWLHYFDPSHPSQLAIARQVGMSDSSVSCYRQRMEAEIRKLLTAGFTDQRFRFFVDEVSAELSRKISAADRAQRLKEKSVLWAGLGFAVPTALNGRPAL